MRICAEAHVGVDIFKFDPNYLENEDKYKQIKTEILGDSDSDDESGSGSDEDSDEDEEGMSRLASFDERHH